MFHPWNGRSGFDAAEPTVDLLNTGSVRVTDAVLQAMAEREMELRMLGSPVADIRKQVALEFGFDS
jgi:hypothetical protein